jgi:hypothetical protein
MALTLRMFFLKKLDAMLISEGAILRCTVTKDSERVRISDTLITGLLSFRITAHCLVLKKKSSFKTNPLCLENQKCMIVISSDENKISEMLPDLFLNIILSAAMCLFFMPFHIYLQIQRKNMVDTSAKKTLLRLSITNFIVQGLRVLGPGGVSRSAVGHG